MKVVSKHGRWSLGTFGAIVGWLVVASTAAGDTASRRFEFTEVHMGMPVSLALYSPSQQAANRAAQAVYAKFAELNKVLSDYDSASELSRLSHSSPHAEGVKVSEPLWVLLARSQQFAAETNGAFDISVGPLVRLWRRARRQAELPSDDRLTTARAAVGYRFIELDEKTHAARLTQPNMQLDLGGIAVGYAVDECLKILKQHGIHSAMIDASGDIGALDAPPDACGWSVGLVPLEKSGPPTQFLQLANQAVTTSGDAFQFVEIDGKRYSHIVDPRTGMALTSRLAVTVVANDCITADSLATAVGVFGVKDGIALAEKTPDVAVLIVDGSQNPPTQFASKRWNALKFRTSK